MDVRVGPARKLSAKELMLFNCDVGETLESLGLQRDPTSPSKEISPEYSLEGLMLKTMVPHSYQHTTNEFIINVN